MNARGRVPRRPARFDGQLEDKAPSGLAGQADFRKFQLKGGTYGEVVIVPLHAVVKQPASLSFTEAASIWMMFVTAYGALIEDAKVGKGDFVLIPAALGSPGTELEFAL